MKNTDRKSVSKRSDLILFLFTILIFIVTLVFAPPEKALAVSILAGLVYSIIQDQNYNDNVTFWIYLSIIVVVHLVVIFIIDLPRLKFGLLVLPLAIIDGFVIWKFLSWVSKSAKQ